MGKRFIIAGMGRTGTMWLANMLNKHPMSNVSHEPFTPATWPENFKRWACFENPIVGMVNSYARFYMEEIEMSIHPQWGFLWREPFALIRSIVSRDKQYDSFSNDAKIRMLTPQVFGELEAMLVKVKQLDIQASHWRFENYMTQSGFLKLSNFFGITFDKCPDLDGPTNAASQRKIINGLDKSNPIKRLRLLLQKNPPLIKDSMEWKDSTKKYITDVVSGFPNVAKAYTTAQ